MKKWYRETKWANAFGKNVLIDARHRVATDLQFIKKMEYLQSTIKWSALEQGIPYTTRFVFSSTFILAVASSFPLSTGC